MNDFSTFRGERLREAKEARGINGIGLAELMGVSRQSISQYEHNEVVPSAKMIESMAATLRMPLDYFFSSPDWPSARPRFTRSMATTAKAERTRAERRFDWLVGLGRHIQNFVKLPPINIPKIDLPSRVDELTDELIESAAQAVRRHWKLGDGPISNVVWLLENNGVVVGQSRLLAAKLDALSDWDDERDGRSYFLLGMDKRSAVRSRFDAAHELGHAILHRHIDRTNMFKSPAMFDMVETQAHRFAGAFLLPADSFSSDFVVPTLDHYLALKRRWLASVAMMVRRSRQLHLISDEQYRLLSINISRKKWRDKEPFDDVMVVEQPRMLTRTIELLVSSSVQTRDQITAALQVPASDIEEIANLTSGFLSPAPNIVLLKGSVVPFSKRPVE